MGELLAVHNEKLDKQDRIDAVLFEKIDGLHKDMDRATDEIKKGCERDIRLVDQRLRMMEKKNVDNRRCINCDQFCSISYWTKIYEFIDSTTTIEYNTDKVITIE